MSTKFEFKDTRPFKEKAFDFSQSLLFWRGRKKGRVWTRDIDMGDIREIFFPQTFEEKYSYLGSVPYNEDSELFKAMYPLILAMDYEARPKWCPRWFLRFLHTFGSDKSVDDEILISELKFLPIPKLNDDDLIEFNRIS